jgi:riboflavin biosynthesis pyrimidine reductase
MVQGGGAMNGSFLKAGLIDEISHLTVPVADGGVGVQTFFDIPGRAPKKSAANLKLISHRMLAGGVSWAKYRVI